MLRIISLCLTIERQLLCSERDIGVVRCEGNSLDPHHLRTSRHKPGDEMGKYVEIYFFTLKALARKFSNYCERVEFGLPQPV